MAEASREPALRNRSFPSSVAPRGSRILRPERSRVTYASVSAGEPLERPEDQVWMTEALAEARRAADIGEVPIGAVVVREGEILGRGHNRREIDGDPLAHAEILAIREAASRMGGWRLSGATMYVTLEPCPMCAGALVNSRVHRLVYGAADPKAGYCGSLGNLVQDPRLNHRLEVTAGVLESESAALLRGFFASLRRRP
jgi:tRNA(adenine34) deaminase